MSDSKITPVGIGSAAVVGGAAGILAHKGITKAAQFIREAKPDSYTAATVKQVKSAKDKVVGFFTKYLGKEAIKGYYNSTKTAITNFFQKESMKKVGKFLKHPVTIGVAAGVGLYIAAKKLFTTNTNNFVD